MPEKGRRGGVPSGSAGHILRVLGIDPGMGATGFGAVETEQGGTLRFLGGGVVRPGAGEPFPRRLLKIFLDLRRQIEIFSPDLVGIERPFFGKNAQSAMTLGQARGAAILAAAQAGLPVEEFSPLEVKQAVVGYGRASKEQVQAMVRALLPLPGRIAADAADALAVAVCVAHSLRWPRRAAASSAAAPRLRERLPG